MSGRLQRSVPAFAWILTLVLVGACTVPGPRLGDSGRQAYGITFYEPFDNSRDWGPAYLVGPPLSPKLYPNDYSSRSADSVLYPPRKSDVAPSIPTISPDSAPPIPPMP